MANANRTDRGQTLVGLLVVLTTLGVLGALVAGSLNGPALMGTAAPAAALTTNSATFRPSAGIPGKAAAAVKTYNATATREENEARCVAGHLTRRERRKLHCKS